MSSLPVQSSCLLQNRCWSVSSAGLPGVASLPSRASSFRCFRQVARDVAEADDGVVGIEVARHHVRLVRHTGPVLGLRIMDVGVLLQPLAVDHGVEPLGVPRTGQVLVAQLSRRVLDEVRVREEVLHHVHGVAQLRQLQVPFLVGVVGKEARARQKRAAGELQIRPGHVAGGDLHIVLQILVDVGLQLGRATVVLGSEGPLGDRALVLRFRLRRGENLRAVQMLVWIVLDVAGVEHLQEGLAAHAAARPRSSRVHELEVAQHQEGVLEGLGDGPLPRRQQLQHAVHVLAELAQVVLHTH